MFGYHDIIWLANTIPRTFTSQTISLYHTFLRLHCLDLKFCEFGARCSPLFLGARALNNNGEGPTYFLNSDQFETTLLLPRLIPSLSFLDFILFFVFQLLLFYFLHIKQQFLYVYITDECCNSSPFSRCTTQASDKQPHYFPYVLNHFRSIAG